MMQPKLTHERLKELLHYDPLTGVFTWKKSHSARARVGTIAGYTKNTGRIELCIDNQVFYAHRVAWFYVHGEWPIANIDHINGDPSCNRIDNLRDVTQAQNAENRRRVRSDSRSGLIGAMPHQGAWRSDISVKGKKIYLGTFATKEEAHAAYIKAKRELHQFSTL